MSFLSNIPRRVGEVLLISWLLLSAAFYFVEPVFSPKTWKILQSWLWLAAKLSLGAINEGAQTETLPDARMVDIGMIIIGLFDPACCKDIEGQLAMPSIL
ncbi:MAG: hypothetical protein GWP61_11830 [Chloroflexi bacterium]|nr:hypothetical protein [Chloroflexota bacterium]